MCFVLAWGYFNVEWSEFGNDLGDASIVETHAGSPGFRLCGDTTGVSESPIYRRMTIHHQAAVLDPQILSVT